MAWARNPQQRRRSTRRETPANWTDLTNRELFNPGPIGTPPQRYLAQRRAPPQAINPLPKDPMAKGV
jgi:hypothetical protein